MLDVLMYIFENYVEENSEFNMPAEVILSEMQQEGFSRLQILQAINWFVDLGRNQPKGLDKTLQPLQSMRYFLPEEMAYLGLQGADFLLSLGKLGIVDHATCEMILDRVMALGYQEIQITHLKWVALMVLFNQPGKKHELNLLQDLVLLDGFRNDKKH